MAVDYNASIVTSGLLANYDFANPKSFNPTQNLFTYSADFTNANWAKSTATITGNSIIAPDGTLTADTITEDTTTNQHLVTQTISPVAVGNVFTLSVYAKAGTRTSVSLTSYGEGYSVFDLSNGTITQAGGNICSITNVGNGWYRCSATITKTNVTAGNFYIIMWNGSNNYLGTNAYLYLWGAQLELNSTMNVYTPTTSTTVTRSTNIIDTVGGYNISNSYGNNAIYINTTSTHMQFSRTAAIPKDGGGASVTMTGGLTVSNFLYKDHTWEVWFRIDDRNPGNTIWTGDATEGRSCLANYAGWHQGFQYDATTMYYAVVDFSSTGAYYNGASWTLGASGAQINQGSWYQIAVTRSGSVYTPYLNGVPLGTGATITSMETTNLGTGNAVWLGKVNNALAGASSYLYYSKNSVSNMKMYNRALSAEEINTNFQALRGRLGI